MVTEKRSQMNLANAISERTCPPSSTTTVYCRANKPAISLPDSATKFPKLKCKISEPPEHSE